MFVPISVSSDNLLLTSTLKAVSDPRKERSVLKVTPVPFFDASVLLFDQSVPLLVSCIPSFNPFMPLLNVSGRERDKRSVPKVTPV